MAGINSLLPPEILEKVFSLLPVRDLRRVVLVCRRWRQVGEAPHLWAWLYLVVRPDNLASLPEVLASRRLQGVTGIKLEAVSEDLLACLASHPGLRSLDLHHADLSGTSPYLLAFLLSRLERGTLWFLSLSSIQAEAIFSCLGTSRLRQLDLSYTCLSHLAPALLASSSLSLHQLRLRSTSLSQEQLTALCSSLGKVSSSLCSLDLSACNLSTIEPSLLASGLSSLTETTLHGCSLTNLQASALLSSLEPSSKLRQLDLSRNDLSSVPPTLLVSTACHLSSLQLEGASLTPDQVEALLSSIARGAGLQSLSLSDTDLSLTRPGLLAASLPLLASVSLASTSLTREQIEALLTSMDSRSSNLRQLDLSFCPLSSLPSSLLAKAVQGLQQATLRLYLLCLLHQHLLPRECSLTGQQVSVLCSLLVPGQATRLGCLNLQGSSVGGVEGGLLRDSRLYY